MATNRVFHNCRQHAFDELVTCIHYVFDPFIPAKCRLLHSPSMATSNTINFSIHFTAIEWKPIARTIRANGINLIHCCDYTTNYFFYRSKRHNFYSKFFNWKKKPSSWEFLCFKSKLKQNKDLEIAFEARIIMKKKLVQINI